MQVKRFLRLVVEPQVEYGPAVTVSFIAGRRPELFSFDENGIQVNTLERVMQWPAHANVSPCC